MAGIMKKIKLKYPVIENDEVLYEVEFRLSLQEELTFPNHPPKASEAQKTQRQSFRLAAAYVSAALADPELRAYYQEIARQQGKRPRDVAFSDYMKGNDRFSTN
jgi:hypothetical protein